MATPAGKWLGFVTAVWVQAISGNNYTFSNYSDAIKNLMGLTQLQLNHLSMAKDVGKASGVLAGIVSDKLPTSVMLLIGLVEGLVGYGAQWLVVSKTIAPLPYWQMWVFLFMGGNSTTWMNTAVLVTCMRNFRRNRGRVSGILKGYVGLSTAIFTDISGALLISNNPSYFLLMLSVVHAVVCLAAMLFLHVVVVEEEAQQQKQEKNDYFCIFEIIAVVVAVYLVTYKFSSEYILAAYFAAGLLLLLVAPLGLLIYLIFSNYKKTPLIYGDMEKRVEEKDKIIARRNDRPPELGEDHSFLEVIKTSEFWVVFISFFLAMGMGLAVQNNMEKMGSAMGHADVSLLVSLISRISSGVVSEYFIRILASPRPVWNATSQFLMFLGYLIMVFINHNISVPRFLFIGSIIVRFCSGIRLTVTVTTVSELFGLKYFGLMHNIFILNLHLGSFLFSNLLATQTAVGGNTCVDSHCYRLLFIILAVISFVVIVLDSLLTIRTMPLYKKICADTYSRGMEDQIEKDLEGQEHAEKG